MAAEDTPTKKFFISYARGEQDDEELASSLHRGLMDAGHEVFIDQGIQVGSEWAEEISRRIEWCDLMIVLLSANSIQSEMVREEVQRARDFRKARGRPAFIPIRVKYPHPQYLGYVLSAYLGGIQSQIWSGSQDSPRLLHQILELDWQESKAAPRPPPSVAAPPPARPQPTVDLNGVVAPSGAIWPDDPLYITRPADNEALAQANQRSGTLVISAPRQMGKSSLLQRYLARCREAGKATAVIDLGLLSDQDFASYPALLHSIASEVLYELGLDRKTPSIGTQQELTRFIERTVAELGATPLVLAFDEADRVFGQDYRQDFFSMFRAWHGRRPHRLEWRRTDLVLVISTEPYLLVDDPRISPFNVSPPIHLKPFTLDECRTLNLRCDNLLIDDQVQQLWQLLGGHPFLTRLAYYRLTVDRQADFGDFTRNAANDDGPFADHLRALLTRLQARREPDLKLAMKRIIEGSEAPSREAIHRLQAAGLVDVKENRAQPANRLYACFFRRVL